tara:strand:- start:40755 stop:41024 length:270 start_codon:yes stop_codon:yes gene_type:complete
MIGSVYNILRKYGYTYDKYDNDKHCYIKENISIYVIDRKDGIDDLTYDCSVYINDVFYENTHTDEDLSDLLQIVERDENINNITNNEIN